MRNVLDELLREPRFPQGPCLDNIAIHNRAIQSEDCEAAAKFDCFRCQHRKECLEFSISKNIKYGVYGGLGTSERQALQEARNAVTN